MWMNGKAQAQYGYNDDLVTSLAIMLFIRDTALRMRSVGIELTKRAIANTHKAVYTINKNANRYGKMRLPRGRGYEDLDWLK